MNAETGLFELDEAAVKSVLLQPQVKNRKIAIVSIVGAFRRGKSFLLNFMLRYLNAKVNLTNQIKKPVEYKSYYNNNK
jgi:atlastin